MFVFLLNSSCPPIAARVVPGISQGIFLGFSLFIFRGLVLIYFLIEILFQKWGKYKPCTLPRLAKFPEDTETTAKCLFVGWRGKSS